MYAEDIQELRSGDVEWIKVAQQKFRGGPLLSHE